VDGRHIIGCGTGRSGTTSLAHVIGRCRGIHCTHEDDPRLPWKHNEELYQLKIKKLFSGSDPTGDVYLGYLPYVRRFLADFDNLKVVCVERDREEVIKSYLAWTKPRNLNHWIEHDGTIWQRHGWDIAYPKFQATTKEEALGMYWDHYYQGIRAIQADHPARVLIVQVESLNTEEGQDAIFDFLELPPGDRYYTARSRLNQGAY
jgi:hypothetical protein